MNQHICRLCSTPLTETFADLGHSPLANNYRDAFQLHTSESYYPLRVYYCTQCFLVQLPNLILPETLFTDYAYFSSYSDSWLKHCRQYTQMMIERFGLNDSHQVVEIASNDGYLLQYFKQKNIPVLGIEPAQNIVSIAEEKGIPTVSAFFGTATARALLQSHPQADLLIGNNVLAHVPNLHDFVEGCKILLSPNGILTLEFPHLLQLIANTQFDTIYHEHYSYLSLHTVMNLFSRHGLQVFDVEEPATHGGSLRVFAQHADTTPHPVTDRVNAVLQNETNADLQKADAYKHFQNRVYECKYQLLSFLLDTKAAGKTVAAYGAAAKGNTLLNYCGIKHDMLSYVVDRSPYKQGKFLPGSHIPIVNEDRLHETKPDYIIILPWNIKEEIKRQLAYIKTWEGKFVLPIPSLSIEDA